MIFDISVQDYIINLVKIIGRNDKVNLKLGDYFSISRSRVDIIYVYKGKALGQLIDAKGVVLLSKQTFPYLKTSLLSKKIKGYFVFANKGISSLTWSRKGRNEEFYNKKYGSLVIDAGYGCKINGYDKDKLASWIEDCNFSLNENGFINWDFSSYAKKMGQYSIIKNLRKFENQSWIKSCYDGKKFIVIGKEKADSNTKSLFSLICKDFEYEFSSIGIDATVYYFETNNLNVNINNPYSLSEFAYSRK